MHSLGSLSVVLYATLGLLLLAAVPGAFVLSREALRRLIERRALRQLKEARLFLDARRADPIEVTTRTLQRSFNGVTIQRAAEELLREAHPEEQQRMIDLFASLGLTERLIEEVRTSESWSERTHAAEVLGLLGRPAAVPALVAALRDPYEDTAAVKPAAAQALARIRDPEVIPFLVRELSVIDEWSSPRVAEALVAFGTLAVPALIELMRGDEEPAASVWAARILGRIGDAAAVPALIDELHHRQDMVRTAAAEALGALGDRRAVQPLIELALRDPVPQVRAVAAGELGRIGDESAIGGLVATLSDPDYGTRMLALEALEMIRPKNTAPIERALHDRNPEVRRRAALALDRIGYLARLLDELVADDEEAAQRAYAAVLELGRAGLVDSLAAYLHHQDFRVRAYMAKACGELGELRVAPLLAAAIDDSEWPVRARLAEAIGRLRGEGGVAALSELLDDSEMLVREHAAEALASYPVGDVQELYPRLHEAFAHGSAKVRCCITNIVARFDQTDTVEWLVRATEDPSEPVRLRALTALATRRADVAIAPLVARLADASLDVRMAAVDALGHSERIEAVEVLLRALPGAVLEVRDRIAQALANGGFRALRERLAKIRCADSLDLRLGIAWTLGKMGDPETIPFLASYLGASEPQLRASAAGALGKVVAPEATRALLHAIGDRDARTRAAVVNALARQRGEAGPIVQALLPRLRDPDAFVRNRVALALGRLGGEVAETALMSEPVTRLVDPTALVVALALLGTDRGVASTMHAIEDPVRLAALRQFLAKEDAALRRSFFEQLHLGDPGTPLDQALSEEAIISQYHELLRSSQNERSRHIAVEALAPMRSQRSLETLADALATDPAEEIRLLAVLALAQGIDHDVARQALARAVADPSTDIATVAVRALGKTRDLRFADTLFKRLTGTASEMEEIVIEALGQLHSRDVVPLVDRMMGNTRPEIVVACLRVLEKIGSPTLLPLLVELLHASERQVRAAAVRAIAPLPLAAATAALDEARGDTDESVRQAVLEAIAKNGAPGAVARMAPLATDPSVPIRRELALRLESLPLPEATALLRKLVGDLSPEVQAASLGTLLAIGDEPRLQLFFDSWPRVTLEARARLRKDKRATELTERLGRLVAGDRTAEVRRVAVMAIAALAIPRYDRYLVDALRDPIPSVRLAALQALAPIDRSDLRDRLQELANDPDTEVRREAQASRLRVVR